MIICDKLLVEQELQMRSVFFFKIPMFIHVHFFLFVSSYNIFVLNGLSQTFQCRRFFFFDCSDGNESVLSSSTFGFSKFKNNMVFKIDEKFHCTAYMFLNFSKWLAFSTSRIINT